MDARLLAAMAAYADHQQRRTRPAPLPTLPSLGGLSGAGATRRSESLGGGVPAWMQRAAQNASHGHTGRSPDSVAAARLSTNQLAASSPLWMRKAATKIASGQDHGGGGGGLFGKIFNNPVSRTLLKPLQVLDTGRRAVQSGIREGVDYFDTNPDTSVSLGDWWKQTKDPTTSLNKLFPDTIWKNPIAGFAGDVATDPLTYLSFGAGEFAGAGGRVAAATRALDAGLGEEVAAKAARLGVNSLTDAERLAIGADKGGLRFAGQRIAGTGALTRPLAEGGATVRNLLQDTPLYQSLRAGTTRAEGQLERMALLRGTSENVGQDVAKLAGLRAQRAGEGLSKAGFHHLFAGAIRDNKSAITDNLHEVIEGVRPAKSLEEASAANALSDAFKGGHEIASKEGVDLGYRENYFPHMLTQDGKKMVGKDGELAKSFKIDPTAEAGVTQVRKLNAGDQFLGETLHNGSVSEINSIAEAKGYGKVLETNPQKVAEEWTRSASGAVGQAKLGKRLSDFGLAAPLDEAVAPRLPSVPLSAGGSEAGNSYRDELLRTMHDETLPADVRAEARTEFHRVADEARQGGVNRALGGVGGTPLGAVPPPAQEIGWHANKILDELTPTVAANRAERGLPPTELQSRLTQAADRTASTIDSSHVPEEQVVQRAAAMGGDPLVDQVEQGWSKLGSSGYKIPDEVKSAMTRVETLRDPTQYDKFLGMMNKYTQFFKAYATLSPGFHVRNAMSATFMNFVAGVDGTAQARALSALSHFFENPVDWERTAAPIEKEAMQAVYASGGSMFDDALQGVGDIAPGKKLYDNRVTRLSRRGGERVEGTVRYAMALDTLEKGGSIDQAAERIARYHFDYTDIGGLDKAAKTVIPFWTFTSRNVPMQMTEMWLNPRLYQAYNSFRRNVGGDVGNDVLPQYFQEQGAMKIGNKTYLAPDLPFNRLDVQAAQLTDPKRLFSQATPWLRLPVELMTGKKLYNNQAIDPNKLIPLQGWQKGLIPLYALTNQLRRTSDGGLAVTDAGNYAAQSLIPTLGQGQRLIPTDESMQQRQLGSLLSYAGIPIKQLTPSLEEGELKRRQAQIYNLRDAGNRWDRTAANKRGRKKPGS